VLEVRRVLERREEVIQRYEESYKTTEVTIGKHAEQEAKYEEMTRQYTTLDADWKKMEAYVRSLNEYQQHIETKYAQLLEQFQTSLQQNSLDRERFQEQEERVYQGLLEAKEQECQGLREEQRKREGQITQLKVKEAMAKELQEEVTRLREVEEYSKKQEAEYKKALLERVSKIKDMEVQQQQVS
jgi:hypothetical protein